MRRILPLVIIGAILVSAVAGGLMLLTSKKEHQPSPTSPLIPATEAEYGDRLRVVFRHMPLRKHEHAPLAARVAEAAGLQGHFWEMHDILYENSLRWTKGVDTVGPDKSPSRRLESNVLAMEVEVRDVFYKYGEILNLDLERF